VSSPPEPIAIAATTTRAPGRIRGLVRARPVVAVWFGTLVFSTGPVMVAAASVAGAVFSFWRLWIGAAVMGLLALVRWRRTGTVPSRAGGRWIVAAGVAFGVHQLLFMVALRTTSVVDVTLMNTLAPVVVAVLAVPMFGERPGVAFRLWSLVAIAGGVVVAVVGSAGPQGQPVGMLLAAGNVVFYSLFFVWSKQARDQVETITFLAGMTLVAAMVVGSAVLVSGAPVTGIDLHDLALCAAVALLPGVVGHFSVTWSLKWVPANIPPVIMLSIPVISGLLAWVLLGQGTTPAKIGGGLLTLLGVAGAVRSAGADTAAVQSLELAEES
jgi:drug/metabolite transporter (DMT)-like permease